MEQDLEKTYLEQALQDCKSCMISTVRLNYALAHLDNCDPFDHIMALNHHSAAVSRMFWPPGSPNKISKARSKARGDFLRNSVGVEEDHRVRQRTLRDHFEHYDERLDEWAESSFNKSIVLKMVGSRELIQGPYIGDGDIIHHFNPSNCTYYFRGEPFNIQQMVDGVEDIGRKIVNRLCQISPWNEVDIRRRAFDLQSKD